MFGLLPYTASLTRNNGREMTNPFSDDFFRSFFGSGSESFRVDVKDEGKAYLMEAELPGMKKEDVHVSLEDGVLTLDAAAWKKASADMQILVQFNAEKKDEKNDGYLFRERRCGSFSRSFNVDGIDEKAVTAEYVDGVLKLHLPKAEAEKPARHEITNQ